MTALLPLLAELIQMGVKLVTDASAASKEEAAALEARLRAALATLADVKASTHAEMDARMSAFEADLAALKAAK